LGRKGYNIKTYLDDDALIGIFAIYLPQKIQCSLTFSG